MRLNQSGKKKKSSSKGWLKASGGVSEKSTVTPKFLGPDVLIGRVSSSMLELSYAPKMKDMATQSLQAYAEEMMIYDDKVAEFRKEAMAQGQEDNPATQQGDEEVDSTETTEEEEVEIEADGSINEVHTTIDLEPPFPPPPKPLFHSQYMVDEFLATIGDVQDHFSDSGGWKIHANAAKFERALDEKYGVFRPFITNHPEIEVFIRSVQRKYAMGYFSPLRQGSAPIPKSTSVILLFMMQRQGVRWDAIILASLFLLVGLQPWALVVVIAIFQQLMHRRAMKPIGGMSSYVEPVEPYWRVYNKKKTDPNSNDKTTETTESLDSPERRKEILLEPVGKPMPQGEKIDAKLYDTIIIGTGPGTLYAGALLARAGRKILVLSPGADASGCITLEGGSKQYSKLPFDVESSSISRITRQQELLAPALCTTTDFQGGVRFAQIGSEADGYAYEILAIPGMGADDVEGQIPFVLRAGGGTRGFMDDTATLLGDGWPASDGPGSNLSGVYLAACASLNAEAGAFYLSKILPDGAKSFQKQSNYQEASCRYASTMLNRCFPLNPHLRSLMAGIGMKTENLKPSNTSLGAHVSTICGATSGEGMHYPVGGPRSLCHALASVIEQNGGRVVTQAHVKELLFKDSAKLSESNNNTGSESKEEPVPPRCIGVKLSNNDTEIVLEQQQNGDRQPSAVINLRGFIDTFVRLLPEEIRTAHKVPMGLPALSERRPVFKVLFILKGSADELSVTGADYYRLPSAALARDTIEADTGAVVLGEIGSVYAAGKDSNEGADEAAADVTADGTNEEKTAEDAAQGGAARGKRTKATAPKKHTGKVKYDAGASWMQISFPSAKDPSWEERHGKVTTCVVTVEADDDFVVHYDTKPKLFSIVVNKVKDVGNRTRLMDKVRKDLLDVYPQLEGKIEEESLSGPFTKGLSHTPERYAAKGVRADTPYPGLFVGGPDLTVGDSFSGSIVGSWLLANAVIGYGTLDLLFLSKNVTSDLGKFMHQPVFSDDEELDVAVPFEQRQAQEEEPEGIDNRNEQSAS
ncbi:All-trans-retinol 13,14-reductase [Seminavis robusta]|uniref:All-trans-retinol 13,14-reductase n=1 Tax=Seminavis robusta TaxID=568900 RepID=A0A9N8DX05_9STRA|nr:All-trans-retinol 13,14-reductase [Seminavis robusta]|eukprot:Sro345_g122390.1 All-trans-retinol 13,14-reductase (1035) ;mRNA; r:11351-14554